MVFNFVNTASAMSLYYNLNLAFKAALVTTSGSKSSVALRRGAARLRGSDAAGGHVSNVNMHSYSVVLAASRFIHL